MNEISDLLDIMLGGRELHSGREVERNLSQNICRVADLYELVLMFT